MFEIILGKLSRDTILSGKLNKSSGLQQIWKKYSYLHTHNFGKFITQCIKTWLARIVCTLVQTVVNVQFCQVLIGATAMDCTLPNIVLNNVY